MSITDIPTPVVVQYYLSKPNTLGTKEKVCFREASALEKFYVCSK